MSTHKMKILFCDNSLKELLNFRGDIIRHFVQKGEKTILVAPNNTENTKLDFPCKLYNITLHRSGMNPLKDFSYLMNLFNLYKNERPDLIFHYTIKPNIYGSIVAKLLGIPSIAIIAGLGYAFNHNGVKTKIARAMYRFAMRFPKKVFVLNQGNMDTLIRFDIVAPEKIILLSGGEGINLDIYK